jgi:hypothetical protein
MDDNYSVFFRIICKLYLNSRLHKIKYGHHFVYSSKELYAVQILISIQLCSNVENIL